MVSPDVLLLLFFSLILPNIFILFFVCLDVSTFGRLYSDALVNLFCCVGLFFFFILLSSLSFLFRAAFILIWRYLDAGSETMRPPLAALSRLAPQLAASAGGSAGSTTLLQPKGGHLTPNNVQHADYEYMGDGSGPAANASSSNRIEDYSSGGGLMPPPSGHGSGGGGYTELTRRPSVAIGGVRSPSNVPNKMELDHLSNINSMAYSNNSRTPAGMIPSGFGGPSNYSNNNNINNKSSSLLARNNSQDQFGGMRGPPSQPLQQQQLQQHPLQQHQLQSQQYSSSYNQAGYDGGLYSSSGDEMRDAGHGQLERGRSSLRRGPALSGNSFGPRLLPINEDSWRVKAIELCLDDRLKRSMDGSRLRSRLGGRL